MLQLTRMQAVTVLCVLALSMLPAGGMVVQYQASAVFGGFTSPAGDGPWLTVRVDDGGSAGSVTMTLSATDLTAVEFVSNWYLQFTPTLNVQSLVFSSPTKIGTFTTPTLGIGRDQFSAGPMQNLDIRFGFDVSGGAGGSKRFNGGESITYTITGIPSLTAAAFGVTGNAGDLPMAAHVQGIGANEDSAWTTVPEPSTLSLLGLTVVGIVRRRMRWHPAGTTKRIVTARGA